MSRSITPVVIHVLRVQAPYVPIAVPIQFPSRRQRQRPFVEHSAPMAGISRYRTTADQSLAIDNVNSAAASVDMVTQWNAAQSEELSATAKQLLSKSAELEGMVRSFRIDGGENSEVSSAPIAVRTLAHGKLVPAGPGETIRIPRGTTPRQTRSQDRLGGFAW